MALPVLIHREHSYTTEQTEAVFQLMAERFAQDLLIEDLALAAKLPVDVLNQAFIQQHGAEPMDWLWTFRTLLAAELIAAHPAADIGLIGEHCGFPNQALLTRRFATIFKETPRAFREHFRRRLVELRLVSPPLVVPIPRGAPLVSATLSKLRDSAATVARSGQPGTARPRPAAIFEAYLPVLS